MISKLITHRGIQFYLDRKGHAPFAEWLESLRNDQARYRIKARIDRMRFGNFGDWKRVGDGVYEHRVDVGPGYRLYFSLDQSENILLLCGGDKSSQASDIMKARYYWNDYKERQYGNKESSEH